MPTIQYPRRGSLAFKPRKRAKRIYPVVNRYPEVKELKPLDFAGYKAGMTHILAIDKRKTSTSGQEIFVPVTIVDCPPMTVFGFRAYINDNGKKSALDVFSQNLSKDLSRKISLPKNYNSSGALKKLDGMKENISDVKLIVHTNPRKSGFGKKKPEVFEVAIGGNAKEKIEYAKQKLGAELKISDIFKQGDYADAIAVTKGEGMTGTPRRYGVKILGRKEGKNARGIGTMGQKRPGKVRWTVPLPGQMGFHTRTELNKRILKIGDGKEINPKGGFLHYGIIKENYAMIQGSLPGTNKRLIRLRVAIRQPKQIPAPEIKFVSVESKQGA